MRGKKRRRRKETMKLLVVLRLIVVINIIFFTCSYSQEETDGYADAYYYEDEGSSGKEQASQGNNDGYEGYEEEASVEIKTEGTPVNTPPPMDFHNGFFRNVGGGLLKVKKPLVDEEYLNMTRDTYECLLLADLVVPIYENVTEEVELSIEQQVSQMKSKLDKALKAATKMMGGEESAENEVQNTEQANQEAKNETDTPVKDTKRLSFREKQALRMQERQAKEAERELTKPKYRLGSDCETLICGSCKALVEEFSHVVAKAVTDPEIKYIDQLTAKFCENRIIHLKYRNIVGDICKVFDEDQLGYKEALTQAFEAHDNWNTVDTLQSILQKQQKVCVDVGACSAKQFEFQDKPVAKTQEQWNASCFVCQAFAQNLEERIHLSKFLTEKTIVPLVKETCDRLNLPAQYKDVCTPLVNGKLLDAIAWLAKVHDEGIIKKAKAEQRFHDKLCEELDWCQPWLDPEKLKEKEVKKTLEPVFF